MTQQSDQVRTVVVQEIPRLRRYAYSLTGSKADADDLVQNVVIRVLKAGIPEQGNAVAWMLRICKNCWIDEIRSRTVQSKAVETMTNEIPLENDGDRQISNELEVQRVVQAMEKLSNKQRMVLSLIAIEGMSYGEAAEVLEVPIGTIMSRVARARDSLHKVLNGESAEIAI